MSLRIVEVAAPGGYRDTLEALAEQHGVLDFFAAEGEAAPQENEEGGSRRCLVRMVCETPHVQELIDDIQHAIGRDEDWRAAILPVEAMVPRREAERPERRTAFAGGSMSREEILNQVAESADLGSTFVVLVLLSTLVAALGLLTDSIAAVIGAMVIAPLLGPNLAFALGAALGNRKLMLKAAQTNAVGIALTVALSFAIGFFWHAGFDASELTARTRVGYDGLALALASGAAAVLSLTTGVSATLVGVMVAVALMPPAAAIGIMLGAGNMAAAGGALLLLAVNVVCVNLAAQAVFVLKGIKPRTWWEKEASRAAIVTNFIVWAVMLAALVALIAYWGGVPVHRFS